MIPTDWDYAVVLWGAVLVLVVGVTLVAGYYWRRMLHDAPNLPLWRFLQRDGIGRCHTENAEGAQGVAYAELRCGACGSQSLCYERLAKGGQPPEYCSNARLLRKLVAGSKSSPQAPDEG